MKRYIKDHKKNQEVLQKNTMLKRGFELVLEIIDQAMNRVLKKSSRKTQISI